ncbi:MAG: hypothetical protein ACP5SI_05045 [Chloroflexia bacterium]
MERPTLPGGLRRLIEPLIEGYATLNRRLWALAVPIGLDLFLWLGPRISPQRLADVLRAAVAGVPQVDPARNAQVLEALKTWGETANLSHFLSAYVLPLLIPRLGTAGPPGYAPPRWAPEPGWALVLPLAAVLVGLLFWSLYVTPLAQLVRGNAEKPGSLMRRVVRTWGRMVRLLAVIAFGGIVFLLPAGFVASVAAIAFPGLATLISLVGLAFLFWIGLYLYFAPTAIAFSGVGPLRAIYYSLQVVRSSFWRSIWFIFLITFVRMGTVALWQRLASHPVGVGLGILGNAYIVGGLTTAGLLFYRDRLRIWLAGNQERG